MKALGLYSMMIGCVLVVLSIGSLIYCIVQQKKEINTTLAACAMSATITTLTAVGLME